MKIGLWASWSDRRRKARGQSGAPRVRPAPEPDPELRRALAPARTQLLRQGLIDHLTGAGFGAVAAAIVVLIAARLKPVIDPWSWCGLAASFVLAAGVILAIIHRPTWARAAAAVDGAGLDERATSALYFGGPEETGGPAVGPVTRAFIAANRRDALDRLRDFNPAEALPLKWPRKAWRQLGLGLIVVLLLAAWPNPNAAIAEQNKALHKAIGDQAKAVEKLKQELTERLEGVDAETQAKLQKSLEELLRELRKARTAEGALRALAETQDELAQLASARDQTKDAQTGRSLAELAGQLGETKAGKAAGEKIKAADPEGAKRELERLSASAGGLDPADRRELAQALERSSRTNGDAALDQAAAQAARDLAGGDTSASTQSLQALASAVKAAMGSVAGAEALARAQSSLQGSQRAVAAQAASGSGSQEAARGSPGGSSGQGGQSSQGGQTGSSPGSGGQGSSGSGSSGSGSGNSGSSGGGQGSSGAGSGSSNTDGGTGQAAPGQTAGSNPNNPSAGKVGRYEKLYDPTRLGGNGETSTIGGQMGEGESDYTDTDQASLGTGALRPYNEVYGRYSQEAMTALDNAYLPIGLRDLVRQYFTALEPGSGQ